MTDETERVAALLEWMRAPKHASIMLPGRPTVTCGEFVAAVDPVDWRTKAKEAGWLDPSITGPGTIAAWCERHRQVNSEGFTAERDDAYVNGELVVAALCYALPFCKGLAPEKIDEITQLIWPFAPHWLKQSFQQHDLVKAAALLAAEVDRLERIDNQALEHDRAERPSGATIGEGDTP